MGIIGAKQELHFTGLSLFSASGSDSNESDRGKSQPGIAMEGLLRSGRYVCPVEIECIVRREEVMGEIYSR
jgi:hypothetical protein